MTVTASSGCTTASASYTVEVVTAIDCNTDTLTIDGSIFGSPAYTYNVRAPTSNFSWTDSNVSSDNSLTTCGGYTWEITQTDGFSPIDSSIFVVGDKII